MSFGGMAGPAASAPGPEELAGYPFNDFGNARRLQRLVGATIEADGSLDLAACTLLYLREVGWIAFNGRFWDRKAGENLARRIAHQVADKVRGLGEFATERGMTAAAFWKFADSCGQAGSTNAMLSRRNAI
jgi:putative DNA primase/helicase